MKLWNLNLMDSMEYFVEKILEEFHSALTESIDKLVEKSVKYSKKGISGDILNKSTEKILNS